LAQSLDLYTLLENCLARLHAGEDLETVLKAYPQQAADLRPLLVAALKAQRNGIPLRVPASAQIDSRTRFLMEAQRRQAQPRGFWSRLNLAGALTAAILLVFVGAFGTSLASADSIPGQTLYPVKRVVERAQLALTSDQSTRLDLEEEFDRRRILEAEKLEVSGRTESVAVAGQLMEDNEKTWRVGGVKLNLTPDQVALANTLNGSYIEVKGEIRGGEGIEVENLELRLFPFSGTIQSIQDNQWKVSGVKVLVMDTTEITGTPRVGSRVDLTTLRYDEDVYLALTVRVSNSSANSKDNSGKDDGKKDDNQDPKSANDDPVKTPSVESTPVPHEQESTRVSTETRESEDSHNQVETPKPTEIHEATRTPD